MVIIGGVGIWSWDMVILLRLVFDLIGGVETTEVNKDNLFLNVLPSLFFAIESPSISPVIRRTFSRMHSCLPCNSPASTYPCDRLLF